MRTKEEIDLICKKALQEYINTPEIERSLTKLETKYKVKRQILSSRFKNWGYEVINQQNRCRLKENVFDTLKTEEQFYWLGFMYADGNVSNTGYRIEVRLSIKDFDHLEKFRQFLGLSTEIRTGTCNGYGFCHLSVRNKHIWEKLNSYGCTPKKSLTLQFPDKNLFNSKKDIFHFMRGYIDGDGCLLTYLNQGILKNTLSLVGTKSFLLEVNKIFKNIGYIRNKSSKNFKNEAYNLSFSSVPSRKIARLLYENATIYLNRKYDKYLEFCRLEEESSRRLSSKIGEDWNVDTELNSEIAQGSESV